MAFRGSDEEALARFGYLPPERKLEQQYPVAIITPAPAPQPDYLPLLALFALLGFFGLVAAIFALSRK